MSAEDGTLLDALPPQQERQPFKRQRLSGSALSGPIEKLRQEQELKRREEEQAHAALEEQRRVAAEERKRQKLEQVRAVLQEQRRVAQLAAAERQSSLQEQRRQKRLAAEEERKRIKEGEEQRKRQADEERKRRAEKRQLTQAGGPTPKVPPSLQERPRGQPKGRSRVTKPTKPNGHSKRLGAVKPSAATAAVRRKAPPAAVSGQGRFPRPPWACEMVSKLRSELEERLHEKGLGIRPLRIGTDCSGAEAPIFALEEICREIRKSISSSFDAEHVFSCDILNHSRAFIVRNCSPEALFGDLLCRGFAGNCLLRRSLRAVPNNLDVYVAGFPCKDFSSLNHYRPCLDGPNAEVFAGVVKYISLHEPRVFVLENVRGLVMKQKGKPAPIVAVLKHLKAIPHYKVQYWEVNTEDFYLPQNRQRVYIVGVHTKKAKLKIPFAEWELLLDGLRSEALWGLVHDYLLDDDEPEIMDVKDRLHSRPVSTAPTDDAAGNRKNGHGTKWVKKHVKFRKHLGMNGDEKPLSANRSGWAQYLSPRSQDVLDMVAAKLSRTCELPLEETDLCAEISRGFQYVSIVNGISPCVTPTGTVWVFNRSRWAIGRELLALQGFPVDDLDLDYQTEADIQNLAGNSMSVPVVGAFLLLVLACVQFPSTVEEVDKPSESASSLTPASTGAPERRFDRGYGPFRFEQFLEVYGDAEVLTRWKDAIPEFPPAPAATPAPSANQTSTADLQPEGHLARGAVASHVDKGHAADTEGSIDDAAGLAV